MSQTETMVQMCRACGASRGYRLLPSFRAPLSTAAWPESSIAAQNMTQQLIDLFACQKCGHIQNTSFNPRCIPVSAGLRMHNQGYHWSHHLDRMAKEVLRVANPSSVVVDVGCGGGEFLERLREHDPSLQCVGIDPAAPPKPFGWRSIRRTLQDGDICQIRPHVVVLRHVLEHLDKPRRFLETIAAEVTRPTFLFVEVPNGEPALEQGRLSDWLYEHCSHFRTGSLRALFRSMDIAVVRDGDDVNGEVLWLMARLTPQAETPIEIIRYRQLSKSRLTSIQWQPPAEARQVVVWGGTGKAAALLHRLVPHGKLCVVDGDTRKVGGWVPGLGIPIQDPSAVGEAPDVIVPSRWRLPDILLEMASANIEPRAIWIEEDGELQPWEGDGTS